MFFLRPYQQQADEMKDRPPEIELRQAILQSSARSIMVSYAMFFGHRVAVQMLYIYIYRKWFKAPPILLGELCPLGKAQVSKCYFLHLPGSFRCPSGSEQICFFHVEYWILYIGPGESRTLWG